MKANKIIWASLVSICLISSCKKNDATPAAPQKTLLTKADYTSVGTYTYTYDGSNRMLTEAYGGNASNAAEVTTISNYDVKGRVAETITDYTLPSITDYKTVVSYNSDGKIESKHFFGLDGTNQGYSFFQYSSGKVNVKNYSSTNAVLLSSEYSFSADGTNVVMYKNFNSAGTLTSTTVYSNFDTKKCNDDLYPYGFLDLPANKNNWQALSRTNNLNSTVTSFTATFTYNADGYPTVRTGSTGANISYDYITK